MKGIDLAKWNGIVDWTKVKAAGVEFAILKAINKQRNTEEMFEVNYIGAYQAGLLTDVYNYSYATSIQGAILDAKKVLSVIDGKNVETVWMDVEDESQKNIGRKLIDMILAYQEVIENAGYKFGIYTGLSFYNSFIRPYAEDIECPFWIARYNRGDEIMPFTNTPAVSKTPEIVHRLWGWQYTSHGRVNGINGNVDLNIRYLENDVNKPENLPTLQKGSRGYYVGYIQKKLNALGYNCGTVDSIFGNNTKQAVLEFQRRNELDDDGIIGVKTWKKLNEKLIENLAE